MSRSADGWAADDSRAATTGDAPTLADVVVIGGGIVGCYTALELARRGLDVVVVEKRTIGFEQSSRNWGYVRQQAREDVEIPLIVEANHAWQQFESEFDADVGWRQRGNLRLIRNVADLSWYERWAQNAKEFGITSEILSQAAIDDLLPGVRGSWAGGAYTPSDGQANPLRATTAVARAAREAGAAILVGTTATAVLVRGGRAVGVSTGRGVTAAKSVVVAGGVWSRRLLAPLGINLPLQWVRSTVAETVPVEGFPDIPAVWSPEVSFRKTETGSVLFAPSGRADVDVMPSALNNLRLFAPTLKSNLRTFQVSLGKPVVLDTISRLLPSRRYRGWEPRANTSAVQRAFRALTTLFPELVGVPIGRSWAGYIDGTPDNLPVLSCAEGVAGLVVGAGFSGHGFGLSPASGKVLADLAETGQCIRHDISGFRLSRFSEPGFRSAISVAH